MKENKDKKKWIAVHLDGLLHLLATLNSCA
jgi:hypothetical protein